MTYLLLLFEFFKAGLFAVGGGMATLPFILKMMERYPSWFGTLTLADITAIAESTPGPIGVNAATFAGYSAGGVPGALVATFGVVLPSFIVIMLVAGVLEKYRNSRWIEDAFYGLRPAVTGLIGAACYAVLKLALFASDQSSGLLATVSWKRLLLFALLFVCTQMKALQNIHPIFYILAGAAVGLLFGL